VKYKAMDGYQINDSDAEIIGPILDELCDKGLGTPDEIIRVAAKTSSPLHPYFTWDDDTAACKWRKEEARNLVNAVAIIVNDENGNEVEYPAYESISVVIIENDEPVTRRTYQRTSAILLDPEKWDLLRMEIRRDLKSIQRKLKVYEGLATSRQMKLIDQAAREF
jgi:hypothetical protein